MNILTGLKKTGEGMLNTTSRFPITVMSLTAAVMINALAIHTNGNDFYFKLLITFLIGVGISLVFQMFYERFCSKPYLRLIFAGVTVILDLFYYLLIQTSEVNIEFSVRTTVIIFILLIAFLWIPVIRSDINFNQSFMALFKAFFMALLFQVVLFLGIILILAATDILIVSIDEKAYIHTANIIFILLAPIQFMSMIPKYPTKKDLESDTSIPEKVLRQTEPAKFLASLISYVVIPITAVFTVILLIYILTNITGNFWTDNLMEPLLVSYSIVVIIVYLLSSTVENVFTINFRRIFPKVLIPIVLFQTISSILKIQEAGISYGRYYVIMFGVFATAAGIWFSIKPVQKNGIIAPILIVLSIVSIFPFIDVFTISRANQVGRLADALERNRMLQDNTIIPNPDISESDKKIIINSVHYLNQMGYTDEVEWLKDYKRSFPFESTFGFQEYEGNRPLEDRYQSVTVVRNRDLMIPVAGYDFMTQMSAYENSSQETDFEMDGKLYTLRLYSQSQYEQVMLLEQDGQEIIRYAFHDIYNQYESSTGEIQVNTEDVTFTEENDKAVITIIADTISINVWNEGRNQQADFVVLVNVK